jgi:hypothetical protein
MGCDGWTAVWAAMGRGADPGPGVARGVVGRAPKLTRAVVVGARPVRHDLRVVQLEPRTRGGEDLPQLVDARCAGAGGEQQHQQRPHPGRSAFCGAARAAGAVSWRSDAAAAARRARSGAIAMRGARPAMAREFGELVSEAGRGSSRQPTALSAGSRLLPCRRLPRPEPAWARSTARARNAATYTPARRAPSQASEPHRRRRRRGAQLRDEIQTHQYAARPPARRPQQRASGGGKGACRAPAQGERRAPTARRARKTSAWAEIAGPALRRRSARCPRRMPGSTSARRSHS